MKLDVKLSFKLVDFTSDFSLNFKKKMTKNVFLYLVCIQCTLGSLTGTGPIVAPSVQLQLWHGAQLPGLSSLAAAPRQVVDGEVEAAVDRQQQVARLK